MNEPENNKDLTDALKAYGLKQDIQRIHKEMMQQLPGKRSIAPVKPLFGLWNKIAAAILVLIIGTIAFVYFDSTSENLFRSNYVAYEESPQRGNETASSATREKFLQGQAFLKSGDHDKAILAFSEILAGNNNKSSEKILNDDAEYYLALSYLDADQPENALPIFQKIHDNPDHLYNDEVSSWYLLKLRIAAWKNK
jgi:tetratricopeptide (TPR) repeat protein